jgi:hypothetical protein
MSTSRETVVIGEVNYEVENFDVLFLSGSLSTKIDHIQSCEVTLPPPCEVLVPSDVKAIGPIAVQWKWGWGKGNRAHHNTYLYKFPSTL